jgi:hypothetical protein
MFVQIEDDEGSIRIFPLATITMEDTGSAFDEPDTYFVNGIKVDKPVFDGIKELVKCQGLRIF